MGEIISVSEMIDNKWFISEYSNHHFYLLLAIPSVEHQSKEPTYL